MLNLKLGKKVKERKCTKCGHVGTITKPIFMHHTIQSNSLSIFNSKQTKSVILFANATLIKKQKEKQNEL